jgi:hypothetical protein
MKLLPSRSGIARSNATRSGWPVLVGTKVPLFALSKVARSGATRSNYHSTKPFIAVNGVPYGSNAAPGTGVLIASLTQNEAINHTPSTATMTVRGFVPVEGADVIITLGSINNLHREFGGTILSTNHRYLSKPAALNMVYDAALIDYTWGLNRRKVSGLFTNTTVAAIAASLMTYTTGGYTLQVDADIGAELIDVMTFTEQDLTEAWSQLTKRVGGDWNCTYTKVVHLFFEDTSQTAPTMLNAVHPSLRDLSWVRDLSQVATRILGEFGGSDALEQIAPGATQIPVGTVAWYLASGGVVLVGQQRVNYSGVVVGGGGALVGPGAAPTAAINALVVPGSGVTVGAHDYAVSYVTASGESLAGPRVSVVSGVIAPPTAALALDTSKPMVAGSGPAPGAHDYALTFVAGGETTPGPRLTVSTGLTAAPTTGPTPVAGAVGVGPDDGTHDYAVTFVTSVGETSASPIGGAISLAGTPVPAPAAPTTNTATTGGAVDIGTHYYGVTFVTARGETTVGYGVTGEALGTGQINDPTMSPTVGDGTGTNTASGGWACYMYAYRGGGGETRTSPVLQWGLTLVSSFPTTYRNVAITVPASPDPNCTGIVLYRANGTDANSPRGNYATVATFSNVQSTFNDNISVYGAVPPANNNTTVTGSMRQTIPVRTIPIGPAGVTARKLYRTNNHGGAPQYLATINNNSTTSYDDAAADSTLGAAGPSSNTAYVSTAVHLTNIARAIGNDAGSVTARKIYRRSAGMVLRFVATIADNSASTYDDTMANSALGAAPPSNTAYLQQIPLTVPLGGPFVTNRYLYRTKIGSSTLYFVAAMNDNVTTTFLDTILDANITVAAPSTNTANAAQVNLSAIPIGATGVTQRRLYRTAAGASQLKLLATLADNVATAYNDILADAALGANAPTSDTSLLQQPSGNVLAGATALPLASIASFSATGGWAIVASQMIRYTGISGNNLTGVPASGVGSIGATITFNVSAVAAPMLIGVPTTGLGTIKYSVLKGDQVNIFVQADDLAAQAAVRTQIPGSDGIIENEIQDRRLSYTEGVARCNAQLELLAARDVNGQVGVITVNYVCRDINTHAGRPIAINLGPPINLRGTFLIQRVGIAKFYIPHLNPTYTVQASSLRFTYDELLRLIKEVAS